MFKSVKDTFGQLAPATRRIVIAAIGLLVVVALIGVASFAVNLFQPGSNSSLSKIRNEPQPDANGQERKPVEVEPTAPEEENLLDVDGFKVEIDDQGFAVMPVTTDPAEAAAGAAAVMLTADPRKYSREVWLSEVISRVTKPSKKYVGIEHQIINGYEGEALKTHPTYFDGKENLEYIAKYNGWIEPHRAYGIWWAPMLEQVWDLMNWDQSAVSVQPFEVVEDDVLEELGGSTVEDEDYEYGRKTDREIDTPGATFKRYFVNSKVTVGSERNIYGDTPTIPASMWIYCDPPELGGICALASYSKVYPKDWNMEKFGSGASEESWTR